MDASHAVRKLMCKLLDPQTQQPLTVPRTSVCNESQSGLLHVTVLGRSWVSLAALNPSNIASLPLRTLQSMRLKTLSSYT
jgi:hypothetical protein